MDVFTVLKTSDTMLFMRSCSVFTLSTVLLFGCATQPLPQPDRNASKTEPVKAVVKVVSMDYEEYGGAATYMKEQQHMLAMRPADEGIYVKLEPKAKSPTAAGFTEFKVPAPVHKVTESVSRSLVVFFSFNSAKLGSESKFILKKIAAASPDVVKVSVQGFADIKGKPESNMLLSRERAAAVVAALVAGGIPESKISSNGFGSDSPIDDNTSLLGRSRNRRVEINIIGEDHPIGSREQGSSKSIVEINGDEQ